MEGGYVYEDSPNVEDENTHYLKDFSSPGRYHRLTKDINKHDRFDYIVYPPELFIDDKDGLKYLASKIVVQSVSKHFNWKKERPYSETNQ